MPVSLNSSVISHTSYSRLSPTPNAWLILGKQDDKKKTVNANTNMMP
jgi:hypothetical protein